MITQPILELVVSDNGFGFRSDTGEVFRLNATAQDVIAWMRECDNETAVVQRLADRYQVPMPRARGDVMAFLERLQTLHLLEPHAL